MPTFDVYRTPLRGQEQIFWQIPAKTPEAALEQLVQSTAQNSHLLSPEDQLRLHGGGIDQILQVGVDLVLRRIPKSKASRAIRVASGRA